MNLILFKKTSKVIISLLLIVVISSFEFLIDFLLGDGNGIDFLNLSSLLFYFKILLLLGACLYSLKNHLFLF